jgi:hypothetical protein
MDTERARRTVAEQLAQALGVDAEALLATD